MQATWKYLECTCALDWRGHSPCLITPSETRCPEDSLPGATTSRERSTPRPRSRYSLRQLTLQKRRDVTRWSIILGRVRLVGVSAERLIHPVRSLIKSDRTSGKLSAWGIHPLIPDGYIGQLDMPSPRKVLGVGQPAGFLLPDGTIRDLAGRTSSRICQDVVITEQGDTYTFQGGLTFCSRARLTSRWRRAVPLYFARRSARDSRWHTSGTPAPSPLQSRALRYRIPRLCARVGRHAAAFRDPHARGSQAMSAPLGGRERARGCGDRLHRRRIEQQTWRRQ